MNVTYSAALCRAAEFFKKIFKEKRNVTNFNAFGNAPYVKCNYQD